MASDTDTYVVTDGSIGGPWPIAISGYPKEA